MKPGDQNEDVKIIYEYQANKSKTIDVKYITAWTNESYVPIPVFIYDKTLACTFESYAAKEADDYPFDVLTSPCHLLPSYKQLDFGPVAAKYTHSRELKLINLNPVPIFLQRIRRTPALCNGKSVPDNGDSFNSEEVNLLQVVPVRTIDIYSSQLKRDFANEIKLFNKLYRFEDDTQDDYMQFQKSDFTIPPNSIVYLNVELVNPVISQNGCYEYEANLHFNSFQLLDFKIPISYQVYAGDITLFPSSVVRFPPSIPGVVQSKKILARSTIDKTIYIKSVTSSNPNKVVATIISNTLEKRINKEIIEISTVPYDYMSAFAQFRREVLDYMIAGQRNQFRPSQKELYGSGNEPTLTYFDILAWQAEQKQWDNRESPKSTDTSSIITIETNMIQNITLPVSTVITKPSLLSHDTYTFDKIEVGTETRGTITIHNPSPNPLEVSFFIAPANFMESIIGQILHESNLPKWKNLCDKSTFFDPYGRKMCQDILELEDIPEVKKKPAIDYFLRNYFNFIMHSDIQDRVIKEFIQEQQAILLGHVQNITDATNAVKPDMKKELKRDDIMTIFQKFIDRLQARVSSFFSSEPQSIHDDANDEIIEEIKVRINKYIDETSPGLKQEFRNMLNIFRGNFYIEHTSKCKHDPYGEEENKDCHMECNGRKFIIPGRSSIDYSCFHFHPLVATNHTETYLLIKNNLTHIYPLKLVGSSGKAVFKIERGPTQSQANILQDPSIGMDMAEGVDLFFNLNMKHSLFKVKAFENLSQAELAKQLRSSLKGNERLTAKDLSIIKEHKINFNITNIGNFPSEIKSVSIGNHGSSFNGFTVTNDTNGYTLTYTPNFKNSRVTETLKVRTKYSESEFIIQAYIPMHLIKYIDDHFTVADIEEKIGNWNYVVLFALATAVFYMFASELIGYAHYIKERNDKHDNVKEQYQEHREESKAKAERKVVNLEAFIQDNKIAKGEQIHEAIFDAYASATI